MALSHLVGIEIDAHTVRAVEVKGANTAKPTIYSTAEITIPPNGSNSDQLPDTNELAIAFEKLWREGKFRTKDVVIGIGAQNVLVREDNFPVMSEKDLKTAIPLHVRGTLQVPIDEAVIDFYPNRINNDGNERTLSGILISVPSNILQRITDAAHTAKLKIESIDFSAFALSRLMRSIEPNNVSMLTYLGQHSSFIVINVEGTPEVIRVIPVGRNSLFERVIRVAGDRIDPRKLLELFPEMPEELSDLDFTPVSSYISQIVKQITSTQNYFYENRGREIHDLMVLGVSHKNHGVFEMISTATNLPLIDLATTRIFKFKNQYLSALFSRRGTYYAVALGLTMRDVK